MAYNHQPQLVHIYRPQDDERLTYLAYVNTGEYLTQVALPGFEPVTAGSETDALAQKKQMVLSSHILHLESPFIAWH